MSDDDDSCVRVCACARVCTTSYILVFCVSKCVGNCVPALGGIYYDHYVAFLEFIVL